MFCDISKCSFLSVAKKRHLAAYVHLDYAERRSTHCPCMQERFYIENQLKLWKASGVNAAKCARSSITCIAHMPPSRLYSITKFVCIKLYTNKKPIA